LKFADASTFFLFKAVKTSEIQVSIFQFHVST